MPIVFDPERKWFFVHIPKTAGTSFWMLTCKDLPRVSTANADGIDDWTLHHQTAAHWMQHHQLQDYTPVSIIRNPWDRALSFYLFHLKLSEKEINHPRGKAKHTRLIREGFKGAWMPGGFYDEKQKPKVMPQSNFLVDKSVYFRIEDQVDELLKFTGRTHLPQYNVMTRGRDYRPYYDTELKERIATLFADDIKLGGYTF